METTQNVTVDTSSVSALTKKAQHVLQTAQGNKIEDDFTMQVASDDLRAIKALQKDVESKRVSITAPLNQALKAVNDMFRAPKQYLEQAESTIKHSLLAYQQLQRIELARKQAEQEELARKERERLAIEAESLRQEASNNPEMAAVLEVQAAQTEVIASIVQAAPVTVAKAEGVSTRKTYHANVEDMRALLQAVLDGKAPPECVLADMKFLNAQARAFKKAGMIYPGVKINVQETLAARS